MLNQVLVHNLNRCINNSNTAVESINHEFGGLAPQKLSFSPANPTVSVFPSRSPRTFPTVLESEGSTERSFRNCRYLFSTAFCYPGATTPTPEEIFRFSDEPTLPRRLLARAARKKCKYCTKSTMKRIMHFAGDGFFWARGDEIIKVLARLDYGMPTLHFRATRVFRKNWSDSRLRFFEFCSFRWPEETLSTGFLSRDRRWHASGVSSVRANRKHVIVGNTVNLDARTFIKTDIELYWHFRECFTRFGAASAEVAWHFGVRVVWLPHLRQTNRTNHIIDLLW